MAASIQQFHTELFEEHLEEASFLYEQRLSFFDDPEMSWKEFDDFEERFEAHVDALVVGDDLALEVCKKRCAEGDFGELHAAMRVFCRQNRSDLAFAVLQNMDTDDNEMAQAVIDALKSECPEPWFDDLVRVLLGSANHLISILAPVLAYRRAPVEDALLRVLKQTDDGGLPRMLWALGRIGGEASRGPVNEYLTHENEAVAEAACRALIRLGDYHAIRHGLLVAQAKPWPIRSLGIGGDHTAVNILTEIVKSDRVSDEALHGLGMLGDLSSVTHIYNCLLESEHALAAAEALQTITGAALYEDVFIPAEIDPDELLDDEREEYEQTGKVPLSPNGEPLGETISQLSVNPDTWKQWFAENKQQFDTKLRYRHGRPISPAASLYCLMDEYTPHHIRVMVCDEMVVRYDADLTLEPDMRVSEQDSLLAELVEWVRANQSKFSAGRWYFAGKPMG